MKKQRSVWLVVVIFLICLPVTTLATVTKGQIMFYEDTSFEYPSGEQQSEEPPDSTEETYDSSESKTEDTTTSSSHQVISGGNTGSTPSNQKQIDGGHKNQQNLLQTNETISYVASVLGSLILIFALYKIRRNIS